MMNEKNEKDENKQTREALEKMRPHERRQSFEALDEKSDELFKLHDVLVHQSHDLSQSGSLAETEADLRSNAEDLRSMAEECDELISQLNSCADEYDAHAEIEARKLQDLQVKKDEGEYAVWSLEGSELEEEFQGAQASLEAAIQDNRVAAHELRARAEEAGEDKARLLSQADELSEKAQQIEESFDVDPEDLAALEADWEADEQQASSSSSPSASSRQGPGFFETPKEKDGAHGQDVAESLGEKPKSGPSSG